MRLRNVKNSHEKLVKNEVYFIEDATIYKNKWNQLFGNNNPIHIEIGMGKGKFLCELAKENPDINYIGIEKYSSVLVRASEKLMELDLPNVKIICFDAQKLAEIFMDGEVSRIYLNFSDPWPKKPHAKRRLTSPIYLKIYESILAKNGEIHFKTDNRGLFEYSLESINNYGMILANISLDLHNSNYENNICTEYEEKFSQFGPIYRLEAHYRREE